MITFKHNITLFKMPIADDKSNKTGWKDLLRRG